MNKVYALRIYKIEPHQKNDFETYLKGVENSEAVDGIEFTRSYKSEKSYTKKSAQNVYVLLTVWTSMEKKQQSPHQQDNTYDDFLQFDLNLVSEEGWSDVFTAFLEKSNTIEFGIREIPSQKKDIFLKRRTTFMNLIHKNDGAVFDTELKSIDGTYNIMLFGWESFDHFNKGAKTAFSSFQALTAMIRYFPLMKQKAFQVGRRL